MTVVLDAYAVIAVARRQAGAETVREAIEAGGAIISWINLGEVYHVLARAVGDERAQEVVDRTIIDARAELPNGRVVLDAAQIKAHRAPISYADAFCVATARRHAAPVLTGDPEILALSDLVDVVDLRDAA